MSHDRGSGKIKLHADFPKSRSSHHGAQTSFFFGIEHEEPAAAGPDKFAAERAAGARKIVELIDFAAAHAGRSLLLMLPVNIHQASEFSQVAGEQRVATLHAQLL